MAILRVFEKTGALSSINEKGETEYTRIVGVLTDSGSVGNLAVRTATGVPRIGDIYATPTEYDAYSVCKKVTPQQDQENPRAWEVRVEYGAPSEDSQQQNPNPVLRPAVITWGFNKASRVCWSDANGKGIMNSAVEYFDPPPEIDDSRPVLSITRNEPSFNPAIAINYQDAVNSDGFFGASAGQCKIAGITASNQTENNVAFWQVSYEFEFRREGWKLRILDQGRNKRVGGKLQPINQRDENGNSIPKLPVADPVPLDSNGGELINPTPDTVFFKVFDVYKSVAFAPLGLP